MLRYIGLILVLLLVAVVILSIFRLRLPIRKTILLMLIPLTLAMLVFDGYLTALPIVEYNKNLVLGIHIGSIPIEDFGYLLVVVLLGPALFERFIHNDNRKK
ncbi:MAG: lycopene cyclase domain-containing protein [Candidatus Saccharibacteria bacterium]